VRGAAVGFAIGSAIYWQFVAPIFIVMLAFASDNPNLPGWMMGLLRVLSFVPAIVYALLCYLFIRWAVRRFGGHGASSFGK
jgi:hypothetical protein